jgi:hypothetical protein
MEDQEGRKSAAMGRRKARVVVQSARSATWLCCDLVDLLLASIPVGSMGS